jgi:hypothetical protein
MNKLGASGEIKILRLSSMPGIEWHDGKKKPAGIATWQLDAVPFFPPSFLECRRYTRPRPYSFERPELHATIEK